MPLPIELDGEVTGVGGVPGSVASAWEFVRETSPFLPFVPEPAGRNLFTLPAALLDSATGSAESRLWLGNFSRSAQAALSLFDLAHAYKFQIAGPLTVLRGLEEGMLAHGSADDAREQYLSGVTALVSELSANLPRPLLVVLDEPWFELRSDAAQLEVEAYLGQMTRELHGIGCAVGVHCCREERWLERWDVLRRCDVDVLSLPWRQVTRSMVQEATELNRGLLLGVYDTAAREASASKVPQPQEIASLLANSTVRRSKPLRGIAFTPDCGLTRFTPGEAHMVMQNVAWLAREVRTLLHG